jgi:hypothetical protein
MQFWDEKGITLTVEVANVSLSHHVLSRGQGGGGRRRRRRVL